jgi:hypothetical protein
MTLGREDYDPNNAVSSQQLTMETSATKRKQPTSLTQTLKSLSLHQRSLPTLPFDIVAKILCMLPVKLLMQVQRLCKSFNSIISDPKFAKKHLRLSTKRRHLKVGSTNFLVKLLLFDSPIQSVFSTSRVTQIQISHSIPHLSLDMCSSALPMTFCA